MFKVVDLPYRFKRLKMTKFKFKKKIEICPNRAKIGHKQNLNANHPLF